MSRDSQIRLFVLALAILVVLLMLRVAWLETKTDLLKEAIEQGLTTPAAEGYDP